MILLPDLAQGRAKGSVKALFKKRHARVDELEAERKRGGKAARSKARR